MAKRARPMVIGAVTVLVIAPAVALLIGCPDPGSAGHKVSITLPVVDLRDEESKAAKITDPLPAAFAYARVAVLFAEANKYSHAAELADNAQAKRDEVDFETVSPADRTRLFADLAIAVRKAKTRFAAQPFLDEAVEASKSLDPQDQSGSANALARLAVAHYALKNPSAASDVAAIQKAESIAVAIEDPVSKTTELLNVAAAYREMGNAAQATRVFNLAQDNAEGIADGLKKSNALTWVAMDYLDQGDADACASTIEAAEEVASALKEPEARGNARITIARRLLDHGQRREADYLLKQASSDSSLVKGGQQKVMNQQIESQWNRMK